MSEQNQSLARYYAKKKKIKKRRAVVFYTILVTLLISVITVLSLTVFFNINKISVTGNDFYTDKQIIKVTGLKKGQNLFRLNKFKIIEHLKEQLPYLDTVEIDRHLPVSIEIKVAECEPFLAINTSKTSYLVDSSLKILEKTETPPTTLAQVKGFKVKNGEVGGYITDKNGAEKRLKQLCEELYKQFGTGKVTKIDIKTTYDIKVTYEDRVTIKLGTLENLEQKLSLVNYVLNENSKNEHAQIDVSSGTRAYYKAAD